MSSEVIVVLSLIILAVGFIIWVRRNDGKHEPAHEEKGEGKTR